MMSLLHRYRLRRAARTHFGWPSLRPGQFSAMRPLLRRRDSLVVLPTGAGKSAVYQVPATLLKGPTVVISPLLALQQDQIAALNERDNPLLRAVRVSSQETPARQAAALQEIRDGRARFLFITPEQLASPSRLAEVKALRPALVAIDEAHCISAWGHDFRPDYLTIGHAIRQLGRPPVVALTATASPPVREDIAERLGLRNPTLTVAGLDRPNLFLEAAHCPTEDYRWRRLLTLLKTDEGPGIVYAPTRKAAEELAATIREAGFDAQFYHGGMAAGPRRRLHEDFIADKVPIMVATSAFGMGIDKPNIRWVAHVALPDSPDSYLQEIGRAGRDGLPSGVLLLHRPEDVALQRFFASGTPDREDLTKLAAALCQPPLTGKPHTRTSLAGLTGWPPRKLTTLISQLEQVGAVLVGSKGELTVPASAPDPAAAAKAVLAQAQRHQVVQRTRTDMMRQFAEARSCRMQGLLAYFGDQLPGPCGHCDNCHGRPADEPVAETAAGPFPLHSTVRHQQWGTGTVLGYERDRMTVLFDGVGYKTLSVAVVQDQGLLALDAGR